MDLRGQLEGLPGSSHRNRCPFWKGGRPQKSLHRLLSGAAEGQCLAYGVVRGWATQIIVGTADDLFGGPANVAEFRDGGGWIIPESGK